MALVSIEFDVQDKEAAQAVDEFTSKMEKLRKTAGSVSVQVGKGVEEVGKKAREGAKGTAFFSIQMDQLTERFKRQFSVTGLLLNTFRRLQNILQGMTFGVFIGLIAGFADQLAQLARDAFAATKEMLGFGDAIAKGERALERLNKENAKFDIKRLQAGSAAVATERLEKLRKQLLHLPASGTIGIPEVGRSFEIQRKKITDEINKLTPQLKDLEGALSMKAVDLTVLVKFTDQITDLEKQLEGMKLKAAGTESGPMAFFESFEVAGEKIVGKLTPAMRDLIREMEEINRLQDTRPQEFLVRKAELPALQKLIDAMGKIRDETALATMAADAFAQGLDEQAEAMEKIMDADFIGFLERGGTNFTDQQRKDLMQGFDDLRKYGMEEPTKMFTEEWESAIGEAGDALANFFSAFAANSTNTVNQFVGIFGAAFTQIATSAKFLAGEISVSMALATAGISAVIGLAAGGLARLLGGGTDKMAQFKADQREQIEALNKAAEALKGLPKQLREEFADFTKDLRTSFRELLGISEQTFAGQQASGLVEAFRRLGLFEQLGGVLGRVNAGSASNNDLARLTNLIEDLGLNMLDLVREEEASLLTREGLTNFINFVMEQMQDLSGDIQENIDTLLGFVEGTFQEINRLQRSQQDFVRSIQDSIIEIQNSTMSPVDQIGFQRDQITVLQDQLNATTDSGDRLDIIQRLQAEYSRLFSLGQQVYSAGTLEYAEIQAEALAGLRELQEQGVTEFQRMITVQENILLAIQEGIGLSATQLLTSQRLAEAITAFLMRVDDLLDQPVGFAQGGIAYSPTRAMVGENKPEAIVPLAGGRAIPVEMRGAGVANPSISVFVENMFAKDLNALLDEVNADNQKRQVGQYRIFVQKQNSRIPNMHGS